MPVTADATVLDTSKRARFKTAKIIFFALTQRCTNTDVDSTSVVVRHVTPDLRA